MPSRMVPVTRACATALPRREVISTNSPSPTAARRASPGLSSRMGSGVLRMSAGECAVRVSVCQWSRTRPVVSVSGKLESTGSTGSACSTATKRARPLGVANRPSV